VHFGCGLPIALIAASTLFGSPITLPAAPPGDPGQVFVLQDYRWVPVVVRRTPTLVNCSFEVVSGVPSVHAELVTERDFTRFSHDRSYETLASTQTGHSGRFQQVLETPGRYLVLIRNERGAGPVAVSLNVRTDVDVQDISTGISPLRRLVVILASLTMLSGTVFWSGRRLLRAYRNR
jgi:hypothetical protein